MEGVTLRVVESVDESVGDVVSEGDVDKDREFEELSLAEVLAVGDLVMVNESEWLADGDLVSDCEVDRDGVLLRVVLSVYDSLGELV